MYKLCFPDAKELASYMIESVVENDFVVATLFYDDTVSLIHELLRIRDFEIPSIELENPEWYEYEREYYISISGDMTLCVEKAFVDDRYLDAGAGELLVVGDVDIELIEANRLYPENTKEISIGEVKEFTVVEDDYMCDCNCHLCHMCDQSECDCSDDIVEIEFIYDEDDKIIGARVPSDILMDFLFND